MQFVIAKGYKCFDLNTVFKEISINNCMNLNPKMMILKIVIFQKDKALYKACIQSGTDGKGCNRKVSG